MKDLRNTCLYSKSFFQILKNERGTSQIIVFLGLIIITFTLIIFVVEIVSYIVAVMAIQDVKDNLLRDAMTVNNGLTPSAQTYIENVLINKGFDASRISVSGTSSPVPFGTLMEARIEYLYRMPTFEFVGSLFPTIEVGEILIVGKLEMYATGVVR